MQEITFDSNNLNKYMSVEMCICMSKYFCIDRIHTDWNYVMLKWICLGLFIVWWSKEMYLELFTRELYKRQDTSLANDIVCSQEDLVKLCNGP